MREQKEDLGKQRIKKEIELKRKYELELVERENKFLEKL